MGGKKRKIGRNLGIEVWGAGPGPLTFILSLCRVVKEEISDDNARLPCFNGRVVSWVRGPAVRAQSLLYF